jgi:predicted acylesterase/phospholipase RssA/energy-coupling factor transporter ATP-binding protein EcfA2
MPGFHESLAHAVPLIPSPDIAEGGVWDIAQELSLLDIDDISQIPAAFQEQLEAAVRSRMPDVAVRSKPDDGPLQFSADPTQERLRPGTPDSLDFSIVGRGEDEDEVCCDKARSKKVQCYFCWPCDTVYCDDCWVRQRAHKKRSQTASGVPHERTNPAIAKKIQGALESDGADREQAFLHVRDEETLWFSARKDDQDDMVFQDYGRYASLMAEGSARQRKLRYPALVSFVGQTGAGKSTLIRLLIELCSDTQKRVQVPVIGSVNHQDTPTSGDVHLYCDYQTFNGEHPLLYADCEGLDGGEREPVGANSRRARRERSGTRKQTDHANSSNGRVRRQNSDPAREILWATTEERRSREYIVRNLYPRLLFTFSDVVVFVMKNPRVIENAIEQLIRWAAAAIETSSNQPVLPHAIIVLNASPNATDPKLWDVDNSTAALMESVREALYHNHTLRKSAEFWRARNRSIESIESLMMSYYSRVRVVRVPERGRPKLIHDQIELLQNEIAIACEQSRASKHRVRMLLNADELDPYLQYAFDHFCRDLEYPFDFVEASVANNPIPSDFGGNILKLAINVMEVWRNRLDGPKIFKELSFMVASCIMLDSARHRTLGPAGKVFPGYIEHCDDALDDFCDRHWPCEFTSARGRCVNVKAGHNTKGHQLSNGQVLAAGDYQSSFSSERYRATFRDDVYGALVKLLEKLHGAIGGSTHLELEEAANIHRDLVLRNFFQHLNGPHDFISHTACFSCLVAPPEHPLPCGHVLCTPCVKAFGMSRGKTVVQMVYCPLHATTNEAEFDPSFAITIKPPGAGARILTLDGGGIRGIVQLTILQQLERALGVGLPLQVFFDLIVGTGSGGMIALGLGTQGWSVQESIKHLEEIWSKSFSKRWNLRSAGIGLLISPSNYSRYQSKPLETALQGHYGKQNLFGGLQDLSIQADNSFRTTKVAVSTTTTSGTVTLLANYNLTTKDRTSHQFHRAEKPQGEVKTWEAARATSATPRIFTPYFHKPTGQVFQSGAIYHNNPIDLGMREMRSIWPDTAEEPPDLVLSIGTGYSSAPHRPPASPRSVSRRGTASYTKQRAKIALDHVQSTLNAEQTWRDFIQTEASAEKLKDRYIRLNLPLPSSPPKMDDVVATEYLQEMTSSYCTRHRYEIKSIADRLIATSFYFELKSTKVTDKVLLPITVTGNIHCRFAPGSEEIRALGEAFRKRSTDAYNQGVTDHRMYFVILERWKEKEALKSLIDPYVVRKMMYDAQFSFGQVTFGLSDTLAETTISLCFADTSAPIFYPLSGFPRRLAEEEQKSVSQARQSVSLRRTRTTRSSRRRGDWKLPSRFDSKVDPIQRYVDPGYINPGDATSDAISEISQRFSPLSAASSVDSSVPPLRLSMYQSMDEVVLPAELSGRGVLRNRGRASPYSLDGEAACEQRYELE